MKASIIRIVSCIVALAFSTACDSDSTKAKSYTDEWTTLHVNSRAPGNVGPKIDVVGKHARRLTVSHLRNSIPLLFGGFQWLDNRGRDMFDQLSRTLGEADFLQVTQYDLNPSPLFAKFMDDMAGAVCRSAIESDRDEGTQIIVPSPDNLEDNLRFLRLKLHSIYVSPESIEGLEDLKQLFTDISTNLGDSWAAWYGVCVAMVTAPEFMTY